MKNILITGAAGFIGSNFTHYYHNKYSDVKIYALDKLTYCGNLENLKALEASNRYEFIKGDIADSKFISDLFANVKFDLVINFAAETHVDNSLEEPMPFVFSNIVGVVNLLLACKDALGNGQMIKFHQVSTDEVFGDLGDTENTFFNELTPYDPSSPYSASKASADMICRAFFRSYKLPLTISNCSNNYGPYQYPEKLIPYFFKLAKQGKNLPVYGDGKNIRDWLHVHDHCLAIDLILEKGKLGDTYCVGGNNEIENISIARQILSYMNLPESSITFVEDRKGHDRRYAIDASKIRTELGFEPTKKFEEGLQETLNWYNENEAWWKDLEAKHNRV